MKKTIHLIVIIFAICSLATLLVACGASPTSVSVLTEPNSVVVVQNTEPDLTGGQITVTYSDGTTKTVPMEELELTNLNSGLIGQQSAVLVYTEDGKTFSVIVQMNVVAPSVKRIEVDDASVKKEYIEGETFDRTGLKVTAYFNNGEEKDVTATSVANPTVLSVTTEKVRISYGKAYQDIPVSVRAKALTSLRVDAKPAKTDYYVGETFDPMGLEVSACYDNGSTESLSVEQLAFVREDGSEYVSPQDEEDSVVRIKYEKDGDAYYVDMSLDSILPLSVKTLAFEEEQQTVVWYRERAFDFSQLGTVCITYVNDMQDPVKPSAARFSVEPSEEPDKILLRVTSDPTVTLAVPVEWRDDVVTKLTILVSPLKEEYNLGDTVDLTGIRLDAKYESGYSEEVGEDRAVAVTTIGKDTTEIVVRLDVGGATASYDVVVYATERSLQTIRITDKSFADIKKNYHVDDKVDLDGLSVEMLFTLGDPVLEYEPTTEDVSIALLVNGEYVESDIIRAETTDVRLLVRYADETERVFEGYVQYSISLS